MRSLPLLPPEYERSSLKSLSNASRWALKRICAHRRLIGAPTDLMIAQEMFKSPGSLQRVGQPRV